MKKTFTLLLTALILLTLTACSAKTDTTDQVTQVIAQTDIPAASTEQDSVSVPVETPAPDSTPEPLPQSGDSLSFATPEPVAIDVVPTDTQTGEITVEAAQAIALAHAGLNETDVTYVRTERDHDDGCWKYEIEFTCGDHEYDYDIDACTGAIRSFDTEVEHHSAHHSESHHGSHYGTSSAATQAPQSSELLTESEAKAIALAHAEIDESDARFEKIKLDKDSSVWKYDIEFRANQVEYEYEIHAYTGAILDFDKDYND